MSKNKTLSAVKNDEFYTQYADIQKEINAYLDYDPGTFRGTTVLLPCDDPEWSKFTRFSAENFELLGLEKHALMRNAYRCLLVTNIVNIDNGSTVSSFAYEYDALNRSVVRNADAFGYNDRSEVTSENTTRWSYDEIGNSTNWIANALNQYTSFTYDLDGNLLSDGVRTFTYDAANRLKTVLTNGVVVLTNFYDAKSRRVRKVTPAATHTYFYDDWNLIEERIAYTNGTTSTIHYYWGKDLSDTLHGAGGVGGLLCLTIDGAIYIPCYDANGNITRYLDASGNTVAQYTYDAFGNTISQSGPSPVSSATASPQNTSTPKPASITTATASTTPSSCDG